MSSSTTGVCTVSGNRVSYVGIGTCTLTASATATTDYTAVTGSAQSFTVSQATATVTVSNLAQYYTGSPLPVTVTTIPPGLGVLVLYSSASYPSSTTAPTQPGSYTVTATVTDPNYVGQDTETLVIYPANAGLALQLRSGMPEPSPYGTMVYFDLGLGGTPCPTGTVQFYVDGTASGSAVTLNGSSCSSPLTFQTATLEPGSHSVYAAYSGDTLHAAGNSNTVTHAVMADTTGVTLAATATSLNVGQPVTFTATVNPSSLDPSAHGPAGTVQFFDGSTSLGIITLSSSSPYTAVLTTSSLAAGPHSISATYTSSDGEFTGSSSAVAVTVTVNLIAPTINWAAPANIVYGTPLSGTQLNATAKDATNGNIPVAGTFTYTPAAGTVLPVGTVNLQVSFAPTNTTTYSTQTATVTPASCTTTATSASPAGTYPITCTVGTLTAANYTFTFVSGTLTLNNKTTPTVSVWPTASAITYGQTLALSTLTPVTAAVPGNASVAGTFAWTTSTTVPAAGTDSESVTFTPTDTTDYNTVTSTVTVTVNKATLTVGLVHDDGDFGEPGRDLSDHLHGGDADSSQLHLHVRVRHADGDTGGGSHTDGDSQQPDASLWRGYSGADVYNHRVCERGYNHGGERHGFVHHDGHADQPGIGQPLSHHLREGDAVGNQLYLPVHARHADYDPGHDGTFANVR
ncbi:MAG: Ig-like domain repeat protein [Terracidiphilus sp.]